MTILGNSSPAIAGAQLPRTLVCVSTTLRPNDEDGSPVDYLPGTLDRLDAAGASDMLKLVLSDGPRDDRAHWSCYRGWAIAVHHSKRSSRNNLWRAMEVAIRQNVERLLYFEDDVALCRNAIRWMTSVAIPDEVALVTFSGSAHFRDEAHIVSRRFTEFAGTQAIAVPRRTIEYLAPLDPFALRTDCPHRCGDAVLGDYVLRSPWPLIGIHVPALVRHVGKISTCWPEYSPRTNASPWTYPGDAFDAMTLDDP